MIFGRKNDKIIKELEEELTISYDEYTLYYQGSKQAAVEYHNRYIQAIKKGVNLEVFLKEELKFVKQLIRQIQRAEENSTQENTFLSDITVRRQEAIVHYPEVSYFEEMDYELRKFFGVMKQLNEIDFVDIESILKYKHGNTLDMQLDRLQSELMSFVPKATSAIPAVLIRYKIFVTGTATDSEIEKEKNQVLQRGAAFLKGLYQFLHQEMRKNQTISLTERKTLINKENYLEQVLNDFRIRDIANPFVY